MAKLCIALDLDLKRAEELAHALRGYPLIMKVSPSLLLEGGRAIIERLKTLGFDVFLDLKLHDIPNTVRRAVRSAEEAGADYLTVHTLGGKEMLVSAREGSDKVRLIGVTILTSHSEDYIRFLKTEFGSIGEMAISLAKLAKEAGLEGIVCSAREAGELKEKTGLLTVVPGIRVSKDRGDQRRVATPELAVREGADILVVGREIINSEDPVKKTEEILRRIENSAP